MKRRNLISPLVLLSGLFLIMLVISCGKDGNDGATGPAGPAGPAGPKGDAGSGDIIYSAWLDVPYKADTIHLAGGGIDTVGYYADINVPKLTLALVSTADVKVYINTNTPADPTIYPLPYYDAYSGLSIQFSAYEQGISLYSNGDVATYTAGGVKRLQYRYMIVPGNTGARSSAQVNWSDYGAVKTYLGLKD